MDTRLTTALLALLLAGCEGEPDGTVIDVEVVTAGGASPLEGTGVDHVSIRVRQGDRAPEEVAGEVGASFDVRFPIVDFLSPVRAEVTLRGPGVTLHGAPPTFLVAETVGLLRIPVGAPGTCEVLAGATLEHERAEAAASRLGTFALVVGGEARDGPAPDAEFLDLLSLGVSPGRVELDPIGPARAAAFSGSRVVVLSRDGAPVAVDLADADSRVAPLSLHDRAGDGSSVLSLGDRGAVVVGGGSAEAPSDGVSWIRVDGEVVSSTLAVARHRPALVELEGSVLVAGGAAEGEPAAERLPFRGSGEAIAAVADAPRFGAHAFGRDPVVVVGGLDPDGAPRADTLVLRGCPADCRAAPGPTWETPRTLVSAVVTPDGGWLVGGEDADGPSAVVTRVTTDGAPALVEGLELSAPRAAPAALSIQAGLVYVVGGRDAAGPRRDVEVCFPETLAGL